MKNLNVWVDYRPHLYEDLILRSLQLIEKDDGRFNLTLHAGRLEDHPGELPTMDVILNSTDCLPGRIDFPHQADCCSKATWIAFSPKGNLGWIRINSDSQWEMICPFDINQLLEELLERAKQIQ